MAQFNTVYDFLYNIDPVLVNYLHVLDSKGFSTMKTIVHLSFEDIPSIPLGFRKLLINEISKIRSPHSKALLMARDNFAIKGQYINTDSNSLQPKELFPASSISSSHSNICTPNSKIDNYTYSTPLEKHLMKINREIDEKETEILASKKKVDDMNTRLHSSSDSEYKVTCSKCHLPSHRRNSCKNSPCRTSLSCGKLKLHKTEYKTYENVKGTLKKLIREKDELDTQAEKVKESISSTKRSFPEAVKSHLINANKSEYLIEYGDQVVPLTSKINMHLTILQKYYNNKIPDDLEREKVIFPQIITQHYQRFDKNSGCGSIESRLKSRLAQVDSKIFAGESYVGNIGETTESARINRIQRRYSTESIESCSRPNSSQYRDTYLPSSCKSDTQTFCTNLSQWSEPHITSEKSMTHIPIKSANVGNTDNLCRVSGNITTPGITDNFSRSLFPGTESSQLNNCTSRLSSRVTSVLTNEVQHDYAHDSFPHFQSHTTTLSGINNTFPTSVVGNRLLKRTVPVTNNNCGLEIQGTFASNNNDPLGIQYTTGREQKNSLSPFIDISRLPCESSCTSTSRSMLSPLDTTGSGISIMGAQNNNRNKMCRFDKPNPGDKGFRWHKPYPTPYQTGTSSDSDCKSALESTHDPGVLDLSVSKTQTKETHNSVICIGTTDDEGPDEYSPDIFAQFNKQPKESSDN